MKKVHYAKSFITSRVRGTQRSSFIMDKPEYDRLACWTGAPLKRLHKKAMHSIFTRSSRSVGPFNRNLFQSEWTHLEGFSLAGSAFRVNVCWLFIIRILYHTQNEFLRRDLHLIKFCFFFYISRPAI